MTAQQQGGLKPKSWLQAIFIHADLEPDLPQAGRPVGSTWPCLSQKEKGPWGLSPLPVSQSILTARLGQGPHFVHIGLAVGTVHLHQDKVLVCPHGVRVVRGRWRRKAGPRPWGLCRRALQMWWGLDPREGADGVLVNQGQVGVQRLPRPGVGMGDGGVNGGGGRILC